MIGLDTNVLLRYLLQDDPSQSVIATSTLEQAIAAGETFFVSDIVLCECVWVLESALRMLKADIVLLLDQVLRLSHISFQDSETLWRAFDAYQTGKGDFSDYLIGEIARRMDCDHTLTFDRALRGSPVFQVIANR